MTGSGLGYADIAYVRSLADFGTPLELPHSGGGVLVRAIGDSGAQDAMGCYPLFSCPNWSGLRRDVQWLAGQGLVSLVCIADPFAPDLPSIADAFDIARPFKRHFVAHLDRPLRDVVSKHHRYYVRRAQRETEVMVSAAPHAYLGEWCDLYAAAAAEKRMTGIRAMSRKAFSALFSQEGVLLFRVLKGDAVVAAQVVLRHRDIGFAHLMAVTPAGYEIGASYALHWATLEEMQVRGCKWVHWGGVSGVEDDPENGLALYKRGWSTEERYAWLLGAVLDRRRYRALGGVLPADPAYYFPAYRAGEFR